MSSQSLTFPNVSVDKLNSLAEKASAVGFPMKPGATCGRGSHGGVDITWSYDAPTQTLTITPTSKPIFVSWGFVRQRINAVILNALPN